VRTVTRDEILALEGRKLDAAVAEHVMGWAAVRYEPEMGIARGMPPGLRYVQNVPHYSADLTTAWEVVERLDGLGFAVAIRVTPTLRNMEQHQRVAVWRIVWDREESAAACGDIPTAICRAALLAVCGEGEG